VKELEREFDPDWIELRDIYAALAVKMKVKQA